MARSLVSSGYICHRFALTQIVGLPVSLPKLQFSALLATSASAFLFLGREALQAWQDLPFFCVGNKIKNRLQETGWRGQIFSYPDMKTLSGALLQMEPQDFLYLTGKVRRQLLELQLKKTAHTLHIVELYDTVPTQLALRHNKRINCDIILAMSGLSCFLLNGLEALLSPEAKILCLSDRLYAYLSPSLRQRALSASAPDEASFLTLLKAL